MVKLVVGILAGYLAQALIHRDVLKIICWMMQNTYNTCLHRDFSESLYQFLLTLTFLVLAFGTERGLLQVEASMVFLSPQLCLLSLLTAELSKVWVLQSTQTTLA